MTTLLSKESVADMLLQLVPEHLKKQVSFELQDTRHHVYCLDRQAVTVFPSDTARLLIQGKLDLEEELMYQIHGCCDLNEWKCDFLPSCESFTIYYKMPEL